MGLPALRRTLNRAQPVLPTGAMKTYAIVAPKDTHRRPATCTEAQCPAFLYGWKTSVDEATDLGQMQAHHIRHNSGRRYAEVRAVGDVLTTFIFEAGQSCFRSTEHTVSLEREPLYVVRGGDWRGNPRKERRVHTRPEDWVDDFATHQQQLADRLAQG